MCVHGKFLLSSTNFDTQVPGYYIIITKKNERITVSYYELLLLHELQYHKMHFLDLQ